VLQTNFIASPSSQELLSSFLQKARDSFREEWPQKKLDNLFLERCEYDHTQLTILFSLSTVVSPLDDVFGYVQHTCLKMRIRTFLGILASSLELGGKVRVDSATSKLTVTRLSIKALAAVVVKNTSLLSLKQSFLPPLHKLIALVANKMTAEQRKAVIKNADMSESMQQDAVDCASQALAKYNIEKVRCTALKASLDGLAVAAVGGFRTISPPPPPGVVSFSLFDCIWLINSPIPSPLLYFRTLRPTSSGNLTRSTIQRGMLLSEETLGRMLHTRQNILSISTWDKLPCCSSRAAKVTNGNTFLSLISFDHLWHCRGNTDLPHI
jgi:hypothetical protein